MGRDEVRDTEGMIGLKVKYGVRMGRDEVRDAFASSWNVMLQERQEH